MNLSHTLWHGMDKSYDAAEFYQVKEHWVSGLAMVYMVCYIGGIWAGAWIIDKKGLQYGVHSLRQSHTFALS